MLQKKSKPAPLVTGTGLEWISSPASVRDNSETLPHHQAEYLTARFRLDATRARVVAELAFGRSA